MNKKAIRISIAYRPLETCLGGGVLSSNFVHQMCHQGGGGGEGGGRGGS